MKNFLIIAFIFFSIEKNDTNQPATQSLTILLTHLDNSKLKTNARFYVGDNATLTLDLGGENKIRYTVNRRVGNNPICGLITKDNSGNICAICLTKLAGDIVELELKYSAKKYTYTGVILR